MQLAISSSFSLVGQLFVDGVIAGAIYALIGLGFTVIYRTVKFFHLAHGAVYSIGAYAAYSVVIGMSWNPIVGFFLLRQLLEY